MNESINFTKCKKEKNIFKKAILNINKLSNQIYAKVLSSLKPNLNLPLNETNLFYRDLWRARIIV